MQSQFIAKYENSHLVTRKYKTCHNSSGKITVPAIFRSRRNVRKDFIITKKGWVFIAPSNSVKSQPQPYCTDAYFVKKTLSATPRPLYHWKAESLSFTMVLGIVYTQKKKFGVGKTLDFPDPFIGKNSELGSCCQPCLSRKKFRVVDKAKTSDIKLRTSALHTFFTHDTYRTPLLM